MKITIEECRDKKVLADMNEEVQSLHVTLFPDLFKFYDWKEVAGFFEWSLNQKDWKHFVAYSGEEPIGMIVVEKRKFENNPFRKDSEVIYIHQISIRKDYQRKGVGAQLVGNLRERAAREGVNRIELDVWSENTKAKAFFESQGFDICRHSMSLTLA
jgi:ribosomal protein S18 acetylase RimI-like enzyme